MYLNCSVKIPAQKGISIKKIQKTPYVYIEIGRVYNPEKKYNVPKTVCIGKEDTEHPGKMYPNEKFLRYFPRELLPDQRDADYRSSCLRIGPYIPIRKIVSEYQLDSMLGRLIGKDAGLLLDIAAYTIISEDNAAQYYPDYAYNHALFTEDMRICSDSKVSDFLRDVTVNQRVRFLNEWNEKRDHREKIYISYDATNKNCEAGDIELVEIGHPKDDQGLPVFNYAVAYDRNNREPLFYEGYPGSIVDISQLKYMLGKAKSYGYQHVGFILDRGYFSKENIQFMDANGFEFVIMVKGMRKLVNELVLREKGSFEESRANSIRAYKVSGTTVKHSLYADDSRDRYFHIYFSEKKQASEREELESKIDRMARKMKEWEGQPVRLGGDFAKYFDLIYYHEGKPDEKFMMGIEKTDVIDREIRLCGYFAIITSEKMTASEALILYKSRDCSEKLFRGDKSYLGSRTERVYSTEAAETKLFIEFVAMIIRNRLYTCLHDEMKKQEHKQNYMTVPAALKELEKIEMIKGADNIYRLDHAVTATQKAILKAFNITAANVQKQADAIAADLERIEKESAEKATVARMKAEV